MNRRLMTRHTLYRRLRADGWTVSDRTLDRYIPRVLNEWNRPTGGAGHRVYTEYHYRLVVSYLRVLKLCGADQTHPVTHTPLHRLIAQVLADHTEGYVWTIGNGVMWSPAPPLAVLRGGVATCWPVWD